MLVTRPLTIQTSGDMFSASGMTVVHLDIGALYLSIHLKAFTSKFGYDIIYPADLMVIFQDMRSI